MKHTLLIATFICVVFSACIFAQDKKTSIAADQKWVAYGNADFAPVTAKHDSLAFNQLGVPYAAVIDANNTLTILTQQNNQWVQVGQTIAGAQSGWSYPATIAFDSQGVPYVDYLSTNWQLIVLKLDNATHEWVQVGNQVVPPQPYSNSRITIDRQSLVINKNNVLYVCFFVPSGGPNFNGTSFIEKFDGRSWVQVGDEFDSPIHSLRTLQLAINANEITPIVGEWDVGQNTFSVWEWINNCWKQSSANLTDLLNPHLAVNSVGTPYVAYIGGGTFNRVHVMKFINSANGGPGTWHSVGPASKDHCVFDVSFAISPVNVQFVEYAGLDTTQSCMFYDKKAQQFMDDGWQSFVQSYDANSSQWNTVGNMNAFPTVGSIQLSVNPKDNKPYVIYNDLIDRDSQAIGSTVLHIQQ